VNRKLVIIVTVITLYLTSYTAVKRVMAYDSYVLDNFNNDSLVAWYNGTRRDAGGYVEVVDTITSFTPSSILNITGILDSGNITSVQYTDDGDEYNVSEVNGSPGFDIRFNFTTVPPAVGFQLNMLISYTGGKSRPADVDVWNYTTTSWETLITGVAADGDKYYWVNNSAVGLYKDVSLGGLIQ